MGDQTEIEWADMSFNPWEGCQRVGPGCDHCYAEARNARFGGGIARNWGPSAPRRRTSAANWRKPIAWQRAAAVFEAQHGRRPRVFCASLADVFDSAVNPDWRADLAQLIRDAPGLDWLLLTKRIGNAPAMLAAMFGGPVPPNVYLGATVVDQSEWNRDAGKIAAASVIVGRARVFLSIEPMLGPINLDHKFYPARRIVGHIIVGGESGPNARPMHPDWARSLRDQCAAAGVPFHFKQWGEWGPAGCVENEGIEDVNRGITKWDYGHFERYGFNIDALARSKKGHVDEAYGLHHSGPPDVAMWRVGKARAGRVLDGRTHDDLPTGKDQS